MTDAYSSTYGHAYFQYAPTVSMPPESSVAGSSQYAPCSSQRLTEMPCTLSSPDYSGYYVSPTSASSSGMMQQWPSDVTYGEFDAWDNVPLNSPSTSSYNSFSPQVPPSLSRGSSSCSSSFPDPAYLPGLYHPECDEPSAYKGFINTYNNFACSEDPANNQMSAPMDILPAGADAQQVDISSIFPPVKNLNELNQYLTLLANNQMEAAQYAQELQIRESMFGIAQSYSSPKPPSVHPHSAQSPPEIHAPRPRRAYIPGWQYDINTDVDQYVMEKNPNNTRCQFASAGDSKLDTVMEEVDDLNEEVGESEAVHWDPSYSEDGITAEVGYWSGLTGHESESKGRLGPNSILFQSVSDSIKLAGYEA